MHGILYGTFFERNERRVIYMTADDNGSHQEQICPSQHFDDLEITSRL